jgi:hypothetical protein
MRRALLALAPVVLLAAPAPASAQNVSAAEAGRQSFQLGRALYDQRRWAEALDAFRTSQQVLASPNTLLYIGRCHRELGRSAEAYRTLLQAAQSAQSRTATEPRYVPTAEAAQREAGAITERIAFVIIDVPEQPPALTVSLNGEAVSPAQFGDALAVDPGAVTLEANAAGRMPFRGSSAVSAGQQTRMTVSLATYQPGAAVTAQPVTFAPTAQSSITRPTLFATASTASPLRPLGITTLSLGLAAGVAGIFTGLRARELQTELDRICPSGCGNTRVDVRNMVDEGNSMVTFTNVLWGVGGAMVVAGAIMWIVAPSGGGSLDLFTPQLARVRPYVDPTHGSAGLVGTF